MTPELIDDPVFVSLSAVDEGHHLFALFAWIQLARLFFDQNGARSAAVFRLD